MRHLVFNALVLYLTQLTHMIWPEIENKSVRENYKIM
jgi:hypothetical protein